MATAVRICDYDSNKRVLGYDVYFVKKLFTDIAFKTQIFIISVFVDSDLPVVTAAVVYTFVTRTLELFKILRLRHSRFAHYVLTFYILTFYIIPKNRLNFKQLWVCGNFFSKNPKVPWISSDNA